MQKSIIPGTLKTKDQTASQQVQATGQKNLGEKATGSVKFSVPCASVSGDPPTVPAGTGITANGLAYITQGRAKLDHPEFSGGCKFTDTSDIVAQQAGAKYNIGTSNFSVNCSGCSGISASGSASGGTDNNVTVVSQGDVDAVKSKLTNNKDSENFSKQFQAELEDQGFYVITQTLKASDVQITASPDVGQQASTSNVTAKVTYSALVIKKDDLRKAVNEELEKQIDKKKQKISDGDVLQGLSVSLQGQSSPTVAQLSISKETTAVPILDVASIKKQVGGKKSGEIKTLISAYPGVKDVDVHMSPFWVEKAPKKPAKVTIVLKQVKTSQPSGGQ